MQYLPVLNIIKLLIKCPTDNQSEVHQEFYSKGLVPYQNIQNSVRIIFLILTYIQHLRKLMVYVAILTVKR